MDNSILKQESSNVNGLYQNILQGKAINTLFTIFSKNFKTDKYNSTPSITKNGIQISIRDYDKLTFNPNFYKVLDYIILKLTPTLPYKADESNLIPHQKLDIVVADFIADCNLSISNRAAAKEQLINAIRILTRMNLTFDNTIRQGKKTKAEYINTPVCGAFNERGKFTVVFALDFLKYLSNTYIMPFNINLFKINMKNHPNAYLIARRLLLHKNMNYNKSNADIISIEKLIESVPTLPSYKEIITGARQVKKRIIDPFELALTSLACEYDILSDWKYHNNIIPKSYEDWIKTSINFIIKNYPLKNKDK